MDEFIAANINTDRGHAQVISPYVAVLRGAVKWLYKRQEGIRDETYSSPIDALYKPVKPIRKNDTTRFCPTSQRQVQRAFRVISVTTLIISQSRALLHASTRDRKAQQQLSALFVEVL